MARLDKARRRTVATALCAGDFFREQVEKKLVGPAEKYIQENSPAAKYASPGLTTALTTKLADQALLGLARCCRRPPSDPGRKLPREVVGSLPELWESFVRADIHHRLSFSTPEDLQGVTYSADPEEAHAQVLARWAKILGIDDPGFAARLNVGGFTEAWDWLAEMFIADTLEGMAAIPDRILFRQARRLADTAPPHRARLIENFIAQVRTTP